MPYLIVANWKCNPQTLAEAKALFNSVVSQIKNIKNAQVVICPPFVYLDSLRANGSQDCFWEEKGPYTGEVSPKMLKGLGVKYVIIGHSERRILGESSEMVAKKIKAAAITGLKPIICFDRISQIKSMPKNSILAFEPVSAISRGKTYRPYPIEKAKRMRRALASFPTVLYGGSVNPGNAKDYISAGFQGLLCGQASLNPKEFIEIIKKIC